MNDIPPAGTPSSSDTQSIAYNTCFGIGEIAVELYGEDTPRNRRRAERLIYEAPVDQRIETFLWAGVRCASRPRLRAKVAALAGEASP